MNDQIFDAHDIIRGLLQHVTDEEADAIIARAEGWLVENEWVRATVMATQRGHPVIGDGHAQAARRA